MKPIVNTTALLLILLGSSSSAQFSILIDGQKDSFYSQLRDSTDGTIHIPHHDFLPISGPRPDGESDLSADVWVAWNEQYFYIYAEVKDEFVHVCSKVRPWNDCIELKFDPDPKKKSLTGIVNARLTAQDTADAHHAPAVDNLYPEKDSLLSHEAASPTHYARRKTTDGYALEFRLAWEWIRCKDRKVRVGVGEVFGLAINIHDIDGEGERLRGMDRDGSIQWSAGMADDVWLVPQLLGTVEFLADHKLKFIRRNSIDTSDVRAKTFLSLERFEFRPMYPITIENWRYHSGDSVEWAKPESDDRGWEMTYARFTKKQKPSSGWNGVGWFRTHLVVDSSLWGVPLGLFLGQVGAAEVYLDGKLLYQLGKVGRSEADVEYFIDRNLKPLVFRNQQNHLLAIRYSNFSTDNLNSLNVDAGFVCLLTHDLNGGIVKSADAVRMRTIYQIVFVLLPVVIGAMHLFFFLFYPRARENLFFALFMFCWAYAVFTDYQSGFWTDVRLAIAVTRSIAFAISSAFVFGMITIYSGIYPKLPKQFYMIAGVSMAVGIWGIFSPTELPVTYLLYVLMAIIAFEAFRLFVKRWRAGSRQRWITAVGVAIFLLALAWQLLRGMEYLPDLSEFAMIYAYGLLVLSICVSIDLSRSYAMTTKNLELQLVQVKELSAKALLQERRAKEEELTRRILEADNARKTKELEDARQVQLSLLPKEVPRIANLEIAVSMETATEVGGDYYDFHLAKDGTLTVALGDATGHGAKAGTMVSITKGLFHELAGLESLTSIFEKFTAAMKHMSLGQLYMGLLLVRFKDRTVTASAAGMPPIFLYHAATQSVELVVMKGMPLGGFSDFPYQTRELRLDIGDTVLLMSDGYLEMFNEDGETLDEMRAVAAFKEVAHNSPKEIIHYLVHEGKKWAHGRPQADDVTFVVLKAR